jgi:hypothetical protein
MPIEYSIRRRPRSKTKLILKVYPKEQNNSQTTLEAWTRLTRLVSEECYYPYYPEFWDTLLCSIFIIYSSLHIFSLFSMLRVGKTLDGGDVGGQ